MQKYNYDLDLNSQNSNSQIIRHITAGTEILEFGPAFGRLTRYLQSEMNCTVDIVEVDEESGNAASAFARNACIGEKNGDIETFLWETILSRQTYDYIIFADVLEHLHHPELVLEKCRKFLKSGGEVLCAVPNIAHSSVIISLWNNDFTYGDVGLLDNTHIHFFTRKSFTEMAVKSGFHVLSIEEVDSKVGTNEIPWGYDAVPFNIGCELKFRPEGEAYEYVFCLKDDPEGRMTELYNYGNSKAVECICYVKESDRPDFSENKCIKKYLSEKKNDIYFDLAAFENIAGLCIQMVPLPRTVIKLHCCEINGTAAPYVFSGTALEGNVLVFENNSDIFLNLNAEGPLVLHLNFEVLSFSEAKYITECVTRIRLLESQDKERVRQIDDLKNDIFVKTTLQGQQESTLLEHTNRLQYQAEMIQELSSQIQQLQCTVQEQKDTIQEQTNTIQELSSCNSEKDARLEARAQELQAAEERTVLAEEKVEALEGQLEAIRQSWIGRFLR